MIMYVRIHQKYAHAYDPTKHGMHKDLERKSQCARSIYSKTEVISMREQHAHPFLIGLVRSQGLGALEFYQKRTYIFQSSIHLHVPALRDPGSKI
jgi:hypothetical protein